MFHFGKEWDETVLVYAGKGANRHIEQITIHHGVYTEIELLLILIYVIAIILYAYIYFKIDRR